MKQIQAECMTIYSSSIVGIDEIHKILSYFPVDKRNFRLLNIFKGSQDGWAGEIFKLKVFNKGPTLLILKTTEGAKCGGYTSKNWDGSAKWI